MGFTTAAKTDRRGMRGLRGAGVLAIALLVGLVPKISLAEFGLTASPELLPFITSSGNLQATSSSGDLQARSPFPGDSRLIAIRLPPPQDAYSAGESNVSPEAMQVDPQVDLSPALPETVERSGLSGPSRMGSPTSPPSEVSQPPGPSLLDQMLTESSQACQRGWFSGSDDLESFPGGSGHFWPGFWRLRFRDPARVWYGEAAGLIMGRNDPNRVWFSYQSNNNANELMSSEQARTSWRGGWYGMVGRSLACDSWRLEGIYWGLAPLKGDATAVHPDRVSSTLDFTDVVYANPAIPGLPVELFTGAFEQALWRTNEIHNAEINLLRHRIPWEGYRLGIDWLVGVRYFRFDERLTYASRIHSGPWGAQPELEGYLSDRAENNLIGVQLGFDVRWPLSGNLVVSCRPKVGLYNNHIHNLFQAYRGDGELFAPNPNPPVGDPVPGSYPVSSSDDRFSVLSELEAKLSWQMTRCITAFVGYRVVAVSEIALADEQYPFYVVDIVDAIQHIDSNGDLILHGGFAGITIDF